MTLKAVVLPAPFGPISPEIWPCSTSKDTPSRATMPPKRSVISRTDSNVPTEGENLHLLYPGQSSGCLPYFFGRHPRKPTLRGLACQKTVGRYGSRGADSAASPIAQASSAAATPTNDAVTSCGFLTVATTRPRWL